MDALLQIRWDPLISPNIKMPVSPPQKLYDSSDLSAIMCWNLGELCPTESSVN